MASDVRAGLTAENKSIPSKYFYDARGSELFENICSLPEYYLTRREMALLDENADELVDGFADGDLVELGAGSNRKIRTLLDAMGGSRRATIRYVPLDVSEAALVESGKELVAIYPELEVMGVVGDFNRHLNLIESDRSKVVLFLGSTIGNLDEHESRVFLRSVAEIMGPEDRLLLGLDMVKPREILEAAYNDSQGVTAEFNKNVLRVLNRDLGGDFDLNDFEHVAFFNERDEHVEMHLRAERSLRVRIADPGLTVNFDRGETIRTEISRKFSRSSAEKMVEAAGLRTERWHWDSKKWFAVAEITADK